MADYWPWSLIWKTKLPVKVICYSWLALHGACLTQDNLIRRNCLIANRCYMCQNSAIYEPPIASLHSCKRPWCMFYSIFGLWCVYLKDAVISWSSWQVDKVIRGVWPMIPASIFWVIWNEMDRRFLMVYQLQTIPSKPNVSYFCSAGTNYPLSLNSFWILLAPCT